MEIQAVSPTENQTAPTAKPRPSSSSSRSEASPAPDPQPSGDTIDLSKQGQVLAEASRSGQTTPNGEQRKFSVTDDNELVLQVIDPKTQKVIKSVPSEEEMQLRNAIRGGVSKIIE